jgi:RNA polymerase sigma-70 factor (ECF subfamily)
MSLSSRPASAATPDDLGDLLARIGRADRAAFAQAYRAASPQLFALAIRMMKQRDLAEEVLQEVFVIIWAKAAAFDPSKGTPLAWMASILRNRCIDRLRLRRPEISIEEQVAAAEWPDSAPGPLELALRSADARALGACLQAMEPGPRNAIIRVYYEGLTHAELAFDTGVPLGTLKSWIRRGLMRLKDCLQA